jgi:mRNA-degrading endonuclease RelE of RelBE toxin-antitoxin system
VKIIETPVFTKIISKLLSDDEYWRLQDALAETPDLGDLIPRGRGLRKLRWGVKGKRGKRGGIRVIYYWQVGEMIYFITAYAKSNREDMTPDEFKAAVKAIEEEK